MPVTTRPPQSSGPRNSRNRHAHRDRHQRGGGGQDGHRPRERPTRPARRLRHERRRRPRRVQGHRPEHPDSRRRHGHRQQLLVNRPRLGLGARLRAHHRRPRLLRNGPEGDHLPGRRRTPSQLTAIYRRAFSMTAIETLTLPRSVETVLQSFENMGNLDDRAPGTQPRPRPARGRLPLHAEADEHRGGPRQRELHQR